MFARFFIDRPIFAAVLSIIIMLAGAVGGCSLPVAQYPNITPPTVEVSAVYPGANAQVVAATVAAPIEQQVNGVEGMLYMSSQCANDGTYALTITFQHGTDLNIAQVLVQNRVALAQPVLPDLVQRRGIAVKKKSPSVLMIVNLYSTDETHDNLYLSNYATIQLKDELSRLPGVGDISYLGQRDYSMRLWLDPEKMTARQLSINDVVRAVETQNTQVAAGQIGQPPVANGLAFQLTMATMGRLIEVEEFGDLIVKHDPNGRLVRLRDVANIELGAQGYDQTCTLDGKPSVALSIYQLPGSNALDTAKQVRAKMDELRGRFPPGIDYEIVYDTTPFIRESIWEVFKTLIEAAILVAAVVLLFLQNWRSAVIPLVAVPVAVIGTFAAMAAFGFSLNNLTLFGLVLAIGIVVDDAIVVVEAVEHHIERGLAPRAATIEAMDQVSGPVIAVGLVLSAVFVPCMFIAGITGQFFRQFALTIAVSTLISAFNSLTLSPALCALLLRPRSARSQTVPLPRIAFPLLLGLAAYVFLTPILIEHLPGTPEELLTAAAIVSGAAVGWLVSRPVNFALGRFFRWFNDLFDRLTHHYTRMVGGLLRVSAVVIVVYGGLLALTYYSFIRAPKGFIPEQDKGYLLVNVQLPDSASVGRTRQAVKQLEEAARQTPGVRHTVAIAGQSMLLNANAPNFGSMYVMLDDFAARRGASLSSEAIAARLQQTLTETVPEGNINVFGAPPLDGLGTAGGFKIVIEDRGDVGLAALQETAERIVEEGNRDPELRDLFASVRANTPWIYLDIDRAQARSMGVPISEIFNALQVYLGSLYINDFNRFGRTWQVIVQADPSYRSRIEDIKHLRVRNDRQQMVPLSSLLQAKESSGPVLVIRYNLYPAVPINGTPAPGVSSGEAIATMQSLTNSQLSWAMKSEWTELALLELQTGNTALIVFALGVVLVFLVLAAQYESASLPLAVILVVPMCLLCAVAGVMIAKSDINIFTQVGFVVLIGLACKNAILIVEFARARRDAGAPRRQATLEACGLRLRPIIMTSLAFVLGVAPLVVAEGAGAEMRRTLGAAVFAGMLGVTLFGIFLTPVFFYVIQWLLDRRQPPPKPEEPAGPRLTLLYPTPELVERLGQH